MKSRALKDDSAFERLIAEDFEAMRCHSCYKTVNSRLKYPEFLHNVAMRVVVSEIQYIN